MSNEETKTENSSQEETTYTAEQFKGLLADKQAEVKKRQEAEKQIADLQGKVETLTARTSREHEETSASSFAKATEDRQDKPLTVGQFQKLMAEQNQVNAENAFLVRQAQSEKAAIAELTAAACGEGLDYASVIAVGESNLTEGDRLAIKAAENPATEKYRRCVMLTPELADKQRGIEQGRLLENIQLTGRVPATGAAAEVTATEADVSRMSEAELDKLAESIG